MRSRNPAKKLGHIQQREAALAMYATVRHLSHEDAAKVLGRALCSVKDYRKDNPSIWDNQAAPVEAAAEPQPRPDVRTYVVPQTLQVGSSGKIKAREISLKREPQLRTV